MIAVALYFRGFCGVRRIFNVMLRHLKKPVLTVQRWQLAATAVLMLIAALVAGGHGAASALAGGLRSITAGLGAPFGGPMGEAEAGGGGVVGALRGPGGK